jgi:dephospho-CoA kinase
MIIACCLCFVHVVAPVINFRITYIYRCYNGCMTQKMVMAIVGMAGSGKSTCIKRLTDQGVPSAYFGGIVVDETRRRHGGKTSEPWEKAVREEMRTQDGMAALAKRIAVMADKHLQTHDRVILDGLYSWSEYKLLKGHYGESFVMVAIVADKQKRYERLENRPIRPFTKEEVESRDYAEIENIEKGGPIAGADYTLLNNDTEQDLIRRFDELVTRIGFLT